MGRKPFYTSPEQLETKIEAYFEYCRTKTLDTFDKRGNAVIRSWLPSVIELSGFLGFANRQSLDKYENRNEGHEVYGCIITRAKEEIGVQWLNRGALGDIDSNIARLNLSANHGMSEKRIDEVVIRDARMSNEERDYLLGLREPKQLQDPSYIDAQFEDVRSPLPESMDEA